MSKHTTDAQTSRDLGNPEHQTATPITEKKREHEAKNKNPMPRPELDPNDEDTKKKEEEEIPSFSGHVDDETNAQKIQQRKQADYNALNNIPTAEDDDVKTHREDPDEDNS